MSNFSSWSVMQVHLSPNFILRSEVDKSNISIMETKVKYVIIKLVSTARALMQPLLLIYRMLWYLCHNTTYHALMNSKL